VHSVKSTGGAGLRPPCSTAQSDQAEAG
jgi:hypothetical protein